MPLVEAGRPSDDLPTDEDHLNKIFDKPLGLYGRVGLALAAARARQANSAVAFQPLLPIELATPPNTEGEN